VQGEVSWPFCPTVKLSLTHGKKKIELFRIIGDVELKICTFLGYGSNGDVWRAPCCFVVNLIDPGLLG
jgi:hypothetical protein